MARITLLHTSDFHGRLSEQAAEQIRIMKPKAAPALLLDAGDAVSAGNIGVRFRGEEILRQMGGAGYDALAMGNREFHPWPSWLRLKLKDASFPVLCANLKEPRPEGVIPYRIFELPGLRVAVFGLCVPMIPEGHWARRISPFIFEDPVATAAELAPKLKSEADLVIALTHIGLDADRRLAGSVSELDLILGGHSHTPLDAPEGDSTPILHVAPHGREIGRAVLEIEGTQVRLVSWERIPLQERTEDGCNSVD